MSATVAAPLAAASDPAETDHRREQRRTLVLLSIAALARLPFLWRGFGGHPDEWLVARSGLDVWLHGFYFPSRHAPAFPLDEIVMGGLAWLGGSAACAVAATLACLAALALMRRLAPLHGIRDSFWMVLAFSFEPWVWASSTHDLDYIWGTLALVAAVYLVERRRPGAAGLACAVGYGFRPSSLLWIGPLFIRVLLVERRWQGVLRFVLWAAVPALLPTALIVSAILSRPDFYSGMSTEFNPVPSSLLAGYHFFELIGNVLGSVALVAACVANRERLFRLFRSGEGWVWNYVLIFGCLGFQFWIESGKPEYFLPALPGLFMILGRCFSNNWWKAITIAFIGSAFFSVGFGYSFHNGPVQIELTAPAFRPGVLRWFAERAQASNDDVRQRAARLSYPAQVVSAAPGFDRLDEFYVSSLLKRGPADQARIACPLIPAFLSFAKPGSPQVIPSRALPKAPPGRYPILVCCETSSAVVLADMPPLSPGTLNAVTRDICQPSAAAPTPDARR